MTTFLALIKAARTKTFIDYSNWGWSSTLGIDLGFYLVKLL